MPKPKNTATVIEGPKAPHLAERKIVYENVKVWQMVGPKSLTIDKMKTYLGWKELTDGKGKMLNDYHKTPIQLWHNQNNRFIREGWVLELAQIILNRQWIMNWQPILISKYGDVISGQHRMIAAIFAEQMRLDPKQKDHWKAVGWKGPVTIETLLIEGTEADGKFTATTDHTMPRTDADVIYCDKRFFGKHQGAKEREAFCKIAGNAVRLLWDRTGRRKDAFVGICTPTELSDFLVSHKGIEDAVRSIHKDNTESKVGLNEFMSLGAAAGFLYLMAAATSPTQKYLDEPVEKSLLIDSSIKTGEKNSKKQDITVTMFEKACEFWHDLSTGSDRTSAVKKVLDARVQQLVTLGRSPMLENDERVGTVVKGWNRYLAMSHDKKLTADDVKLRYKEDDDTPGVLYLEEYPKVGDHTRGLGIDMGASKSKDTLTATSSEAEESDPAPEEVATQAEEIREEVVQANGGAAEDESPEAERQRREAIESAKPPEPTPKPKKKPRPVPVS